MTQHESSMRKKKNYGFLLLKTQTSRNLFLFLSPTPQNENGILRFLVSEWNLPALHKAMTSWACFCVACCTIGSSKLFCFDNRMDLIPKSRSDGSSDVMSYQIKPHTRKFFTLNQTNIYLEGFINDLLCSALDCHKLRLFSGRQRVVVPDGRQSLTATKIKRFFIKHSSHVTAIEFLSLPRSSIGVVKNNRRLPLRSLFSQASLLHL